MIIAAHQATGASTAPGQRHLQQLEERGVDHQRRDDRHRHDPAPAARRRPTAARPASATALTMKPSHCEARRVEQQRRDRHRGGDGAGDPVTPRCCSATVRRYADPARSAARRRPRGQPRRASETAPSRRVAPAPSETSATCQSTASASASSTAPISASLTRTADARWSCNRSRCGRLARPHVPTTSRYRRPS